MAQRFSIISLIVMILGSLGIGWWVGEQIRESVIREAGATTALYIQSFISPALQELGDGQTLTPEHVATLGKLSDTEVQGWQIVSFKVWGTDGRILYASAPSLIGRIFPVEEDLARSLQGNITAEISDLSLEENQLERIDHKRLFEIYIPVFRDHASQVIASAEVYFTPYELEKDIAAAQRRSWAAVGIVMTTVYLLLVGFMFRANRVINRQQSELNNRVSQLTNVLAQNEELYDRVRRATSNATMLNEHFLRRIGAELHDGPAQDISLALLRLDRITGHLADPASKNGSTDSDLATIQRSLQHALQEVRATASGLGLPQIDALSLTDTLARAVHAHEHKTGTSVNLNLNRLPAQVPLPIKIAVYRFIQEALNNAFYHAGGAGQQVTARYNVGLLSVEVCDEGPGFDITKLKNLEHHLGLAGMRDRIESLEGMFRIESAPGQGTRVIARLLLRPEEIKE
ncbi:MAG: sensor histidine kinase [Chloroflexi bacterium]|nr:sensor histidine kinase [Chloroflexota bacterium]